MLKPRRKIFRRSPVAWRSRSVGRVLLGGVMVLAGLGAVALVGAMSFLSRPAPAPTTLAAAPAEVAVVSGDTLRLQGRVVRLRGIVAPERGEACAAAADCGTRSAASLAALVAGRAVECSLDGQDSMGPPYAQCTAGIRDLALLQVASGWARAQPGSAVLAAAETSARARRRGQWAKS